MRPIVVFIAATIAAFGLGLAAGRLTTADPNARLRHNGLAAGNCRTLIVQNIRGWQTGNHTAESALRSIDNWCGIDGSLWGK